MLDLYPQGDNWTGGVAISRYLMLCKIELQTVCVLQYFQKNCKFFDIRTCVFGGCLRDYDCILDEVSGTVFKNQLFMLYGVETS